jgi:hypothetical protein
VNVENCVQHGMPKDETGWERDMVTLGRMQCTGYAELSECCTQCMLYSVLTLDHGMER